MLSEYERAYHSLRPSQAEAWEEFQKSMTPAFFAGPALGIVLAAQYVATITGLTPIPFMPRK